MNEEAIQKLIDIYSELETKLLDEIVKHFNYNEEFINSDYWRFEKLEELGLLNENIIEYIAKVTNKTPDEIKKALKIIGFDILNMNNLNNAYKGGFLQIDPAILIQNNTINNIIERSYNEVSNRFIEISKKIENATRDAYLNVVEKTYIQTTAGESYQEAIRNALMDLGNKGITTLTYKTVDEEGNVVGIRNYDVEGAVRRELVTATHNLTNEINKSVAEELEVEYLYLSEHIKCRPQHFPWQGTIIKRVDLIAVTKYGEVDGMGGPNCKHYPTPYFGSARGKELKKISLEEATEQYALSQQQRYLERGIRRWKRKQRIFEKAEDEEYYKKCKDKVKEWQLRNKEFTEKNNLRRDFSRENVEKVTNVQNNDIITPGNLLTKLNIDVKEYVPFGKYDPLDNNIQEQAAVLLKMDGLPKIVSNQAYLENEGNEIVRVVHSYHGKTAEEAYQNTIKGKIQYSENTNSSFGRGIYFGDKSVEGNIVAFYSGNSNDSKIINAKIGKNARILEFASQIEYLKDVNNRLAKIPDGLKGFYEKETSLLYMLDGIDGIKLNYNHYYCIYNRGVLIIDEQ